MTAETRKRALRSAGVALAAALLLAIAGAFDTGAQPLGRRLAYWLVVMGVGSLWGQFCQRLLSAWPRLDERPWLHILILTAAVTVPMCLFVWLTTGLFFHGELLPLSNLFLLIVPVLAVSAAVCTVVVLIGGATPVQTHASDDASRPVPFVRRLPPHLRGARLLAVQAEDHYLRVHTSAGSDLILMRLSDALEELKGLEGAQTHRSWWVAKDAVCGIKRADGRATFELEGGVTAPVSRRYARALRGAGWY